MFNKDEIKGKVDQVKGRAKQAAGDLADDAPLRDEGVADEPNTAMRRGRAAVWFC